MENISKEYNTDERKGGSIKLLTLNTWGLKYVSRFRTARIRAIADRLSEQKEGDDYDIVALQEVWVEEDWNYINNKCRAVYPFRRIFKAGIITGPGLALLSKIPIESTMLYRFPVNGRPSAFYRGDWYVGKSMAVTLLKPHQVGQRPIALLNSHMHAPYAATGDSSYYCHRACQAWDLATQINMIKKAGYAVVQVGDLNSKPGTLPYKLFTLEGGLHDSWEMCQKDNPLAATTEEELALMSPKDQIIMGGVTCNSKLNTWNASRQNWEACRLDYALIDSSRIIPTSAAIKFTEMLPPPYECSYSDHFAYSFEFYLCPADCELPTEEVSRDEKLLLYKEILSEIGRYRNSDLVYQARWRKWHFFLSIVMVVAIHVGIPFAAMASSWSSVLLLFLCTVIAVTGTINGLIRFLSIPLELRALQEVVLQVEDKFATAQC